MKYVAYGIVAVIVAAMIFAVINKVSPVSWGWWGKVNSTSGVALRGYDPVAYFTVQHAEKGEEANSHEWQDAQWLFSSAKNRDAFVADPESYAPQFGGFCAFAVSKGFTADPDPEAWYIHDNQLYVFADGKVRDQWVAGIGDGIVQECQSNWQKR